MSEMNDRVWARRVMAALCVAALLFTLMPPTVGAQDEPDDGIANITLATLGPVVGGEVQRIDAIATIRTERAVAGRLRIVDEPPDNPPTTWEFDLDLAAGSEVSLPFTATTSWQGVRVRAGLDTGDQVVAQADLQAFPDGRADQTLVATLGIDDPPRFVPEFGSENDAIVVQVDNGLASLDRMSSLIIDRTTMRELSNSDRGASVEAWLRGGGQLIVDGPVGSLDDRFHVVPTANPARFLVGAGSLLYAEDWRDGVPIGGYNGSNALARLVSDQGFGSGAAGELVVLAGVGLPRPRTITTVLLGYAAIAGPLLFVVATRRRIQRRIWLALPGLAVLVAGGVLLVGLLNGAGQNEAHITIVEVDEAGSQATSNLLIGSRFGSTREVDTPPGWTFLGQNQGANERAVQVRPQLDGVTVAMDLPPSGNGNMRLTGPASMYDGMVRIENVQPAGPNDVLARRGVVADFVNDSGVELEGVVAFLGAERAELGTVAAGETVPFSIEFEDDAGRLMRELLIWPRVGRGWMRNGPIAQPSRNDGTAIESGAWTQWRIEQGAGAIPAHVLGVVGWTDELAGPVGGIELGNTALFVRTPVPTEAFAGGWAATTYRPSNPDVEVPFIINEFFGWTQDYRFTLGDGVDADQLAFRVGPEASAVSVLVENEWINAELSDAAGRQSIMIDLPDGAAASGELIARALVPEWEWNAPQTLFIDQRSPTTQTVEWRSDRLPLRNAEGRFFDDFNETVVVEVVEVNLDVDASVDFEADVFDFEAIEYELEIESDQTLTATLRSDSGDSYLEIYEGNDLLMSNDDFGGSLDSQIVFTSSNGLPIRVRAQGLSGQPLRYELRLELTGASE